MSDLSEKVAALIPAQRPVSRIQHLTPDVENRSLQTLLTTDIQLVVEAAKVVVETAAGTLLATKAMDSNDKGGGDSNPPADSSK